MLVEKFAELHTARIERYLNLARISLENAEQLGKLQWNNTKLAIDRNMEIAKAMAQTKDITELLSLSSQLVEFNVEKAWAYPLNIYEKTSQMQAELGHLVEESLTSYGDAINQTISASPTTDFSTGVLKATVAATNHMLDQFNKTTRQAADIANTSLKTTMQQKANGSKPVSKASPAN